MVNPNLRHMAAHDLPNGDPIGRIRAKWGSVRAAIFGTTDAERLRTAIEKRTVRTKTAVEILRSLHLSNDDVSRVLDISPRTLYRQLESGAKLGVAEGDRAYRVARIADLATEMLGSSAAADVWLRTRSQYFGSEAPFDMIATEVGTQLVEESLYAIGYGGVG
jgi:putative toxin-antitoxin system antitoxin component (TIGR02293 family)